MLVTVICTVCRLYKYASNEVAEVLFSVLLQGHLLLLPVLLLGIACLSTAPLAGVRSGWAHYYKENVESLYLRDLTLSNWTHWIDIGFFQVPFSSMLSEQQDGAEECASLHAFNKRAVADSSVVIALRCY